jgi:hypothetical protein
MNVSEVFGQRDAARRKAAIGEIFTHDCVFFDEEGKIVGREAINTRAERLLEDNPTFVLRAKGSAELIHDLGRVRWEFGPPDVPPVVAGMDIGLFEQGRIRALYTFLEEPG